jgi:hypothetical protein
MPRCGTTFDENAVPPWTRGDFRGVFKRGNKPTPALRDRCRSATAVAPRHPSQGGDFQRSSIWRTGKDRQFTGRSPSLKARSRSML